MHGWIDVLVADLIQDNITVAAGGQDLYHIAKPFTMITAWFSIHNPRCATQTTPYRLRSPPSS